MSYLKADAVQAVLEDLGVLDRGGNVNTNDSNRVGLRFDAALATLTQADVVTINPAAIPDALFLPLVSWLVQECANLFHKERNETKATDALNGLRSLARRAISAPSTTADKFGAAVLRALKLLATAENPSATDLLSVSRRMVGILADLSRRDIITIASQSAIADAEFEPLVAYTAETLAPEIGGRDAALDVKQAAEARLSVIAREGYTVTDNATNRLAVKVLRSMGLSATGYPSTKELASITARLDQGLRDLAARRVIEVADADQAEELGAFDALTDWFVAQLGPEQGQSSGKIVGRGRPASPRTLALLDAEDRLRRIAAPDSTYPPQVACYF